MGCGDGEQGRESWTADSIASAGGAPSLAGVAASMEQLAGNVDRALHALSPVERAHADELLTEIAGHGLALLGVGELPEAAHSHDELQTILGDAAERANEDAASAEQHALFAVGVAIAAMISTAWVTLRYRYRSASERAVAMTQLRASQRIERLLNDSPDMFVVLGTENDITFASPSTASLLGHAPTSIDDLLACASEGDRAILDEHVAATGQRAGSAFFELTDTTGATGWFELRVSDLTDDELVRGHVVTARDITREVRLRDDLVRQAGTDMLTGLPNRRALDPTLDRAEHALTPGAHVAFLSLDLDGFKEINDTMGHHAGDDLLVQIARRLDRAIQPGQTLLRLGGDEFAVIIESTSGAADARSVAEHLRNVLAAPFRVGPRVEPLRTSIGVAVTADPAHVGALVIEADIAMYQAKPSWKPSCRSPGCFELPCSAKASRPMCNASRFARRVSPMCRDT